MKTIISLFLLLFASLASATDLPCSAGVNGNEVLLERGPSGLLMIAVEDPHFGEYDIVIDLTDKRAVKVRLAKFIPTSVVADLKKEIGKLTPELQKEIIKLAKARVIDGRVGFSSGGTAVISLVQGEDRLDLFCTENE